MKNNTQFLIVNI